MTYLMESTKDGEALREVMRRVPSPVTVVTAVGGGKARGITIGSFTSVSLEPPLISFNISRDAQMHEVMAEAVYFVVHILREEQAHLSNHFALPDQSAGEQFESIPYREGPHQTPILKDVLAMIHCRPYGRYDAGDHTIIVGEVVEIEYGDGADPLVYFDRTYRSVGDKVKMDWVSRLA